MQVFNTDTQLNRQKRPRLTCTQALKVFMSVKGSPWLLLRGWRAVEQSGLCWALRRNGDWTLSAAATVSTGSTSLKTEPKTNIFPANTSRSIYNANNTFTSSTNYTKQQLSVLYQWPHPQAVEPAACQWRWAPRVHLAPPVLSDMSLRSEYWRQEEGLWRKKCEGHPDPCSSSAQTHLQYALVQRLTELLELFENITPLDKNYKVTPLKKALFSWWERAPVEWGSPAPPCGSQEQDMRQRRRNQIQSRVGNRLPALFCLRGLSSVQSWPCWSRTPAVSASWPLGQNSFLSLFLL